jgi:hypothetical protein
MILAQNELQPQEEVDKNGNCGRLPTTRRRILNAPKRMIFQNSDNTTPKQPRIIPFRCGVAAPASGDHFHPHLDWKLSVVNGAPRRPIHAASVLPGRAAGAHFSTFLAR